MGLWGFGKKALNSTIGTANFQPLNTVLASAINSATNTLSGLMNTILSISKGGTATYTANGTFTVPTNVNKIWITACAGGGGANTYNSSTQYGGEGGEWIFKQPFNVTPSQSISIVIGQGGVGKSSSDANPGGNTVIGSLITLLGGEVSGNVSGGSGGVYNSTNASRNMLGADGFSGHGGAYGCGGGSLGRGGNDYGIAGYGGGGGFINSNAQSGGKGIVIIEW